MEDSPRVRELQLRAKHLIEARKYDEALAVVDRALAEQPDNAASHALRGAALSRLDLAAESRAAFEEAVRLEPNEARHHFNLASQLKEMGLFGEALQAAERARHLDPQLPHLERLLSELRELSGEQQQPHKPPIQDPELLRVDEVAGTVPSASRTAGPLDTEPEEVPLAIQRWNWGAFWLTGLWALSHRMYVAGAAIFLAHIVVLLISGVTMVKIVPPVVNYQLTHGAEMPSAEVEKLTAPYELASAIAQVLGLGGLVAAIWFGAAGNRWAWRSRPFRNMEEFLAVQRVWMIWSWIAVAAMIVLTCVFSAALVAAASYQVQPID